MKYLDTNKSCYNNPYDSLYAAYVAGHFDAEGNVFVKTTDSGRKQWYVKILPKNATRANRKDPNIDGL